MVCECSWFKELSAKPGSCIQVVSERQQLQGFKVAVVKEWALNRTRYVLLLCCAVYPIKEVVYSR